MPFVIRTQGGAGASAGAQHAAELSATIMDHAFDDLDAPVERVTLLETQIPYSEPLESAVIPNAETIAAAAQRVLS